MKLHRTKQCDKCPWKVTTNPRDIPNGYCVDKHAALEGTIAESPSASLIGPLRAMACHMHLDPKTPCVGWLMHQLGPGNNIGLRLAVRKCENISDVKLVGEQHRRFKDTLPDDF